MRSSNFLTRLLLVSTIFFLHCNSQERTLVLTDADFLNQASKYDSMLVMFYAPWCGHCKKLAPEFEHAANLMSSNNIPVKLAKVDCTQSGKGTCNQYGITGYPTLKIFKKGVFSKEYAGPLDGLGIVKHMTSEAMSNVKKVSSLEEIDWLRSTTAGSIVVGFFEENSHLMNLFLKAADDFRDKIKFGITNATDLIETFDVNDGVILFRPKQWQNIFEPTTMKYDDAKDIVALEKWLKNNQHGLVDYRTHDNIEEFPDPLVVAYYKIDYSRNPKGTNYWRNRILKVANDFKDEFNFAISSADDFRDELGDIAYDIPNFDKPVVCAFAKGNKYLMEEEFSSGALESFLKKLRKNDVEPYVRSEPIPNDNSKPVKIAVAKNFDEIVNKNGRDTFIEFYAPWCTKCRKFTPIWDEVGRKMLGENVAIVKMDATKNKVPPGFEIRGYPSIFWVPKDSKSSPVYYDGKKSVRDFVEYIAQHATSELSNYDRKGNRKNH